MNIDNFQELIDLTDYLAVSNEYLIRKFKEGGNYLIIDTYGDFLIIERIVMADKIIPNLPKSEAATFDDLLIVVDTPADSPTNKKITLANLFNKIPTYAAHADTPQTLTGAGEINATTSITLLVTTGANALTIADGSQSGQLKYIVMKTDGGVGTLTGSNFVGTSIIFDTVGEAATLIWTDSKWYNLSSSSGGAVWS